MANSTLEIELGVGVGEFKFGITRDMLKKAVGSADEIEKNTEDEEIMGAIEVWHYDEYDLSVEFIEDNDWRLSTIAVNHEDCTLGGLKLIGKSMNEVKSYFDLLKLGEYEIQKLELDDEHDVEMMTLIEAGLDLWFEGEVLTELQLIPVDE